MMKSLFSFVFVLMFANVFGQLSGNYTINSASGDYASFTDAVQALIDQGVSGPVNFFVAPGTYNEQFNIPFIQGTSAINTVTFNSLAADSTDVNVNFAATGGVPNYVVSVDSARYIKFKHMSFHSGGTAWTTCFYIHNGASNISIENCHFTATGSVNNHIQLYDTATKFIDVRNNYLLGNGTGFFSNSPNVLLKGIVLENNVFVDQINTGLSFSKTTGAIIRNNTIINTLTNSSYKGLNATNAFGFLVERNLIKSESGIGANIQYSGTDPSLFINNIIFMEGDENQDLKGLVIGNGSFQDFYNNTIVLGDSATTGSVCLSIPDIGGSGSLNNSFINNNMAVLGEGQLFFMEDIGILDSSDYNNCYTTNTTFGTYQAISLTTLASWQALASLDAHSINVDPMFYATDDFHVCNPLLNQSGNPVGVLTDFDNDSRETTPDIGADEFVPVDLYLGQDTILCAGHVAVLDAGTASNVTYEWSTGSSSQFIAVADSGMYTVTITSPCGTYIDSILVDVDVCASIDSHSVSGIKVFPNPHTGENFTCQMPEADNYSLMLCDLSGRVIFSGTTHSDTYIFSTAGLDKGVYFLMIEGNNTHFRQPVIKE